MTEITHTMTAGMRPNTTRLIHIERPRDIPDPCDECGESCNKPTHWRVRTLLLVPTAGKVDEPVQTVSHACTETCARAIYNSAQVEIALITGQKIVRTNGET